VSGAVGGLVSTIAEPQDRDAVIALWQACGLTRPWNDPAADFDLALAGPASEILLLHQSEALVGSVMVGHDGHRGSIYYLAVDPACRRQGLGRRLMQEAEAWLRERSVPKLNLLVRAENDGVVGFYRALGYADNGCLSLGKRLD
jgi:ribosomal protein S18 acetylase RimI-like enzyme